MKRDPLPTSSATEEVLHAILGELRAIRACLEPKQERDPLLQALRDAVGAGVAFSAAELIERGDEELLAAIGSDPIALGRALAKLEGRGVQRIGRDASGFVWSLM